MAKRRGSKLLKREAQDIAAKLEAVIEDGSKHLRALVYYDEKLVLQFGIRHSRNAKHGHLLNSLHASESYLLKLARCQISREEFFLHLESRGLL